MSRPSLYKSGRRLFALPLFQTILVFAFLSIVPFSAAHARHLYFQSDRAVLRWSEDSGTFDTVWRAPFTINDVSVSEDCRFICFTKPATKDDSRPEREVGYYSVRDRKVTLINSKTLFNFGAIISPSDKYIAFSYLPDNLGWKTALYDRVQGTIVGSVVPTPTDESYNAFSWRSDSLLCFATLDKIVEKSIYGDSSTKIFTMPDTTVSFTVPGAEMIFLGDTAFVFKCSDDIRTISDEFDGPPTNIFLVQGHSIERLFTEKEDVSACYLSDNYLYIEYTDYALSNDGMKKLMRYDLRNKQRSPLISLGSLVGVSSH